MRIDVLICTSERRKYHIGLYRFYRIYFIMSTTTIAIYSDDKKRVEYYKGVFGCSNNYDTINKIMNLLNLWSIEDIERFKQVTEKKVSE